MPLHIQGRLGDVAPVALLVGDPARAVRIASQLDRPRCYNTYRGLTGFSGTFEGIELSVQTTGMGGPSAAIVVEELAQLGVRTVIRLGTCGAVGPDVAALDLVIATAAVPADGTTREYMGGRPYAPVADPLVTRALTDAAAGGSRRSHAGLILSHDAFYAGVDADDAGAMWQDRGVLAIEMETAAIFTVALHRGLRAGAVCLAVAGADEPVPGAFDAATDNLIALGFRAAVGLHRMRVQ